MKKLIVLAALLLLMLPASSWAAGSTAAITVATTGTTAISPTCYSCHVVVICNTGGTNTMDCAFTGSGTVTASNWNFQLAPNTCYTGAAITYAPNQIGAQHVVGGEGTACLAITNTTTATWYAR